MWRNGSCDDTLGGDQIPLSSNTRRPQQSASQRSVNFISQSRSSAANSFSSCSCLADSFWGLTTLHRHTQAVSPQGPGSSTSPVRPHLPDGDQLAAPLPGARVLHSLASHAQHLPAQRQRRHHQVRPAVDRGHPHSPAGTQHSSSVGRGRVSRTAVARRGAAARCQPLCSVHTLTCRPGPQRAAG